MKTMMKKVFALTAVIAVLTTGSSAVFAEYDPNRPIDPSAGITATKSAEGSAAITVNGKLVEGAETYVSESGEVMVPIRAVAEELGFEVGWDAGRVTLTKLPVSVTFAVGTDGYTFARTAPMQIGKAPELTDEKTYVPSAFFSEILEAEIKTNLGGTAIVYGAEQEEEKNIGSAVVKSVEKDEAGKIIFVLIEDTEKGEVQLNIGEETEILKDGEKASAEDLKEGMKLSVEYGEAMTMSLPPQNNPIKLVIEKDEETKTVFVPLESVLKVLGADETEVSKSFTVDDTGELADIVYDDVSVKIKLEFENGRLLRIQYNFGTNTDAAFKFVNEVQKIFEQKWGESDTYETLPDRIKGLTADKYLSSDIVQYKEYWIDTDIDFDGIVPKEYESVKRVDLGIGINKIPSAEPITEVYIGGIVNSTNTTKLSN